MSFFGDLLNKFSWFFKSKTARLQFERALELAPKALPWIAVAAEILAGITPTSLDDEAIKKIKDKFPRAFDGSLKTGDEFKLYCLGILTELLRLKVAPGETTTVLRQAAQTAYLGNKAQ